MAYRKIHDKFWTDPDLDSFTPEQKYFYLYLITNPFNNQIGIYKFSISHASLHTGYNRETIEKLLKWFELKGKIKRSKTTSEIVVCKFWHYNKSNSPKVINHCDALFKEVKDRSLIQYVYGMDTVSIQYLYSMHTVSQEEQEESEGDLKIDLDVSSDLFEEARKAYPGVKRSLTAELDDFKKKYKDWKEQIPKLLPAIKNQINFRAHLTQNKKFVPEWKHFKTWLNNRCWEEETTLFTEAEKKNDLNKYTQNATRSL